VSDCEAPEHCGKICHCGMPMDTHPYDNHSATEMYCRSCDYPDQPCATCGGVGSVGPDLNVRCTPCRGSGETQPKDNDR